jgi:site-specific recombinase XerD
MFHPLLDEFSNLEKLEIANAIPSNTPILVSPDGECDVRLCKFFLSPHFTRLRNSTKQSYAKDLRLWLRYLDSRRKDWAEASPDDVNVYWLWRSRSDINEDAVGGSKMNRELAAISLLYRWASHPSRGYIEFNPIERESLSPQDNGRSVVPRTPVRSKNVVGSRVKWLTPQTFRLWRQVGIEGYTLENLRDEVFRGRTVLRNRAMVDLLYGSGLRITEAGALLLPEIPVRGRGPGFNEAQLSAAIAKGGRSRTWYLFDDASALVDSYLSVTRRAAVDRARNEGRYDDRSVIAVDDVRATTHSIEYRFNGSWHDHNRVDIARRRRMFIDNGDGLEPMWLWLNEGGLPMSTDSWTDVLNTANERVAKLFKVGRLNGTIDRNMGAPRISPHSLRHSFALFMLIALHRAIDERTGNNHATDYDEERYRSAWDMVRDLLGHRSVETTRECYLAPLNGIRLRSVIDEPDLQRALSGLARVDSRIVDVTVTP